RSASRTSADRSSSPRASPHWWWRDEAGGGGRRRLGLDLRQAPPRRAGQDAGRARGGPVLLEVGPRGVEARDRRRSGLSLQALGARRLPGSLRLGLGRLGGDGGDPLLDGRP